MNSNRDSFRTQIMNINENLENCYIESEEDSRLEVDETTDNLVQNRFKSVFVNAQNSKKLDISPEVLQQSESKYTHVTQIKEITDYLSDKGLLSIDLEMYLTELNADDNPEVESLLMILNGTLKIDIDYRKLRNEIYECDRRLQQLKTAFIDQTSKLNHLQNDTNYTISVPEVAVDLIEKNNFIKINKHIIEQVILSDLSCLENPRCVEILDEIKRIEFDLEQ